jgi:hypothetical protein
MGSEEIHDDHASHALTDLHRCSRRVLGFCLGVELQCGIDRIRPWGELASTEAFHQEHGIDQAGGAEGMSGDPLECRDPREGFWETPSDSVRLDHVERAGSGRME